MNNTKNSTHPHTDTPTHKQINTYPPHTKNRETHKTNKQTKQTNKQKISNS